MFATIIIPKAANVVYAWTPSQLPTSPLTTIRSCPKSAVGVGWLVNNQQYQQYHHRTRGYQNPLCLQQAASNDDEKESRPKTNKRKKKFPSKGTKPSLSKAEQKEQEKAKKKEEIMKQLRNRLQDRDYEDDEKVGASKKEKDGSSIGNPGGNLLKKLNPFQAGQSLRQTLGALSSITGLNQETKQKYYLDDRFLESTGGILSERNPYLERQENNNDSYVPEVLVIGATGEIGRMIVRRLLLEGRFRVRVLVNDLYSQTLNLLGTGVTYCQGDLRNKESLEYALTDVDKIIFCAAAPRSDEPDFQEKFQTYLKENLQSPTDNDGNIIVVDPRNQNLDWEQLNSILEVRAQLAEQVDFVGMQNLVRAYQNVRHADYGTSQAAKRSMFKFTSRPDDFRLFSLDEDTVNFLATNQANEEEEEDVDEEDMEDKYSYDSKYDEYDDDDDDSDRYAEYDYSEYDEDDSFEDEEYYENVEARRDATVRSQIQWIRNEFGHGVFVGKVPKTDSAGIGGEASIVSSRLRSREDPEQGIDLGGSFAGFILRLVGDGGNYEAFVRTGEYETTGIEYVCQFSTATKPTSAERKSRNKFITVRLPFENFKPVLRTTISTAEENPTVPPFKGGDVRNIGFRYRSSGNPKQNRIQTGDNVRFYMALSYVKVYRLQPEPEFVYLSDSRIPPVVKYGMVDHSQRRLLLDSKDKSTNNNNNNNIQLLDEKTLKDVGSLERSPEEIYFRFRGEEVLKSSGLSYTIVRVAGYNESPSGDASTIDLRKTNFAVSPISRADAAQVCVSALLDPEALNKSVYLGKQQRAGTIRDEDISAKFAALPSD